MKIALKWKSDKNMIALFSNINSKNENDFYLLMVYGKSKRGGFDRDISVLECKEILKKHNSSFNYKDLNI